MTTGQISRVETNQRTLSRLAVQAIAHALGVNPGWRSTGEGEMWWAPTVEEPRASSRVTPPTWQAAVGPCLAGTPLVQRLSVAALSVGTDGDQVWRELPERKKEVIRQPLRRRALTAAGALDGLPSDLSGRLQEADSDVIEDAMTTELHAQDARRR